MFLYDPTYGSGGDVACADPESFVRGGSTLTTFFSFLFYFDEGRKDPNTTISGSSTARQRNAI